MKKNIGLTVLGLATLTGACAEENAGPNYDEAQLAVYREALPTRTQLEASRTTPSSQALLGAPALYPHSSAELVEGVNGAVENTVNLLELVTAAPPTIYNSDTKEFFWGPWAGDDYGYVAAYIKDTGEDGDFRFEYAFLRGASNDMATLTPIVYGGATPDADNKDHGVGVTVWDMTADNAFAAEYDPNYDAAAHGSGRFAALFGAGPDEADASKDMAFVVAVFRDFVPEGEQDAEPVDLDYFYGRSVSAEATFDFVDYETQWDVDDDQIKENIGVRMAFLDEGTGRAEADAIGGSLENNQRFDVVECWDTSLNETYLSEQLTQDGVSSQAGSLGAPEDCGAFNLSLDDLGVPRLEDIDAELIAALDEVASNGLGN